MAAALLAGALIAAACAQLAAPGQSADEAAPTNLPRDAASLTLPQTRALLALLRGAAEEGLDPGRYTLDEGATNDRVSQGASSEASVKLRQAVLAYAKDLRVPRGDTVTYIDPALSPRPPDILAAPDPAEALQNLQRRNVVYAGLRGGLADYRTRWSKLPQTPIPAGPTLMAGSSGARVALLRRRLGLPGPGHFDEALARAVQEFQEAHGLPVLPEAGPATIDALNAGAAHYERLIMANMNRARGLPVDGRRFILVDSAGAMLRLIENGQERAAMRVIVGKPGMKTPELAGFIRFAIANPSWNIPPDLVRTTVASQVQREGSVYLAKRRFALFTDWRPGAAMLTPDEVDWPAVAQGRDDVWVRQLPGGDNMMGKVKFMMPNRLGIYLHDTPRKGDFTLSDRRLSSGCVRLEDAQQLANWIFDKPANLDGTGAPDTRIDVADPVPVYILYFTAYPEGGKIRFQPDRYNLDPALLARLSLPV